MRRAAYALLFISMFGLYLTHAAPTITSGDSAELAAVATTLGIAHSPGYPTFSLFGRLGKILIPVGAPAYRANIQSSLWSAFALLLFCLCLTQVTGSLFVGALTSVFLGISSPWMQVALATEVFALNTVFAISLFLVIHTLHQMPSASHKLQWGLLAVYLLACGLGNQHTLILLAPALVMALLSSGLWRDKRFWGGGLCVALVGVSIYGFILLRARAMPWMNWEEPATLHRFWKLVTRARYGSLQIAQGHFVSPTIADFLNALKQTGQILFESLGIALIFALVGVARLVTKRRYEWLIALVAAGPIFFALTRLPSTPQTLLILHRFAPLALVPAFLIAGYGLAYVLSLTKVRWQRAGAMTTLVVGLSLYLLHQDLPNERGNYLIWDVGKAFLANTPPNAMLFADRADEAEFAIAYLQRAERRRSDVEFVDCNAGVSRSIYGENYYETWGPPRLSLRTAVEREFLTASLGRAVYYATHDPQMIPIARRQEGLLWRATPPVPYRPLIPWDELAVIRHPAGFIEMWNVRDVGVWADALLKWANARVEQGSFGEAIRLYQGVLAMSPTGPNREQLLAFVAILKQRVK